MIAAVHSAAATAASSALVVLGDSFAHGEGDPAPDGGWFGWAGRLAAFLDIRRADLHNISARGATPRDVVLHQLPRIRDLKPSIVAVGCGIDAALTGFRLEDIACDLASVFQWAQNAVAVTVAVPVPLPPLLQSPQTPHLPRSEIPKRVDAVNLVLQHQASGCQAITPTRTRARTSTTPTFGAPTASS